MLFRDVSVLIVNRGALTAQLSCKVCSLCTAYSTLVVAQVLFLMSHSTNIFNLIDVIWRTLILKCAARM